MLHFSIVVAMASNRAIGSNNQLLWHLPNDLKYFKKLTMGKPIVMGRKTFESIGRILPGRKNIIITRNQDWLTEWQKMQSQNMQITQENNSELITYSSFEQLLDEERDQEMMVIGGGQIYQELLSNYQEYINKIYLTLVKTEFDADVYFPGLEKHWKIISKESFYQDAKHQYDYDFIELVKNT